MSLANNQPPAYETPTAAQIIRAEWEQIRLEQIGGEPLESSGFENEQYELHFGDGGEGNQHA